MTIERFGRIEFKLLIYKQTVSEIRLEFKEINLHLKIINLSFSQITNNGALLLIDKAKRIIRSSLPLLEEVLEIMESI